MKRLALALSLLVGLVACSKAPPNTEPEPVQTVGYSTTLYARIMAGKGSGVVGVPLEGVEVSLRYAEQSIGPVVTDPSGSLSLEAVSFFPEGTTTDPQGLATVTPVNVELHLSKVGYRPTVEIVTFPVEQFKEFTFYLKGEGS